MKNDSENVSFSYGLSYMVAKNNFDLYMDAVGALGSRKRNKKKEDNVGMRPLSRTSLISITLIG